MVKENGDAKITAWALDAGRGYREALTRFVRATQRDVLRPLAHLASPAEAEDLASSPLSSCPR
ncbi:hypothetical protein [Pseudonocardia sp. WMMC193]|uniref:hypothetical protein n=1 Tax=Pseudonocardia sp. WMMC193 TaxID=2911965 RepID=UPI001F1975BF|nr:hypothetical protein [Pseudonocardia sp. WMMC193]MCF7552708.1 hypothetical protein [Pseudonocardia sp. WMMC193]